MIKQIWRKIDESMEGRLNYDDKYLPDGWRSMYTGMGNGTKVFVAPDGTICQGRRMALVYMVTELKSSEDEVILMRRGLMETDKWEESEDTPPGWLWRAAATNRTLNSYHF